MDFDREEPIIISENEVVTVKVELPGGHTKGDTKIRTPKGRREKITNSGRTEIGTWDDLKNGYTVTDAILRNIRTQSDNKIKYKLYVNDILIADYDESTDTDSNPAISTSFQFNIRTE